jgi:2-haloacid dehalogenase
MFDAVLSADAVRAFKTHPDVYQYALRSLDLPASAISFQSSNAWDAHGASDFGMRVVWCNRYGQRRERLPGSARPLTVLSEPSPRAQARARATIECNRRASFLQIKARKTK